MTTAAERQAEFMRDLRELLRKYDAEIEIRLFGYPTEAAVSVYIRDVYRNNERIADAAIFDLPWFVDGEEQGR